MKELFFNPIRMISPRFDSEALRLEELHKTAISESYTLEEGLVVMLSKLIEMTRLLKRAFHGGLESMEACKTLAEEVHKQEKLLTANLVCSTSVPPELCKIIMLFPGRLERTGDFLESILNCCHIKCKDQLAFTDQANADIDEIFDLLIDILSNFRDAIIVPNKVVLKHVIEQATKLDEMCQSCQLRHVDRLLSGSIAPRASSSYLDILESAQSIGRHINEMAERLLQLTTAIEKK